MQVVVLALHAIAAARSPRTTTRPVPVTIIPGRSLRQSYTSSELSALPPIITAPCHEASLLPPGPVIPLSPYNPLTTPSFRHSPPRLPSDQPWRFPSPATHFISLLWMPHSESLGMVRRKQASPSGVISVPSAIDVSPVIIAPR